MGCIKSPPRASRQLQVNQRVVRAPRNQIVQRRFQATVFVPLTRLIIPTILPTSQPIDDTCPCDLTGEILLNCPTHGSHRPSIEHFVHQANNEVLHFEPEDTPQVRLAMIHFRHDVYMNHALNLCRGLELRNPDRPTIHGMRRHYSARCLFAEEQYMIDQSNNQSDEEPQSPLLKADE